MRIAQLQKARGLVGGVGVDGAAEMGRIAGEDAHGSAVDARQRGDDGPTEAGPQLEPAALIDQRVDDRTDVADAKAVRGQQLAQRRAIGAAGCAGGNAASEVRQVATRDGDAFGFVGDEMSITPARAKTSLGPISSGL